MNKTKAIRLKKHIRDTIFGGFIVKRECGIFRANAKAAKSRLGSGFWGAEREKRGGVEPIALDIYVKQLKRQITADKNDEDAALYERVQTILSANAGANPLGHVLDRDYMVGLSDADRERYVFDLSRRVQKCIERFKQEEQFVSLCGVQDMCGEKRSVGANQCVVV